MLRGVPSEVNMGQECTIQGEIYNRQYAAGRGADDSYTIISRQGAKAQR